MNENNIDLTPGDGDGDVNEELLMIKLNQQYKLNINHVLPDGTKKLYSVQFSGSRTVQEVKNDVYSLIDVPKRHQNWVGWPSAATDESMTLAGCDIDFPVHYLEVSSTQSENADSVSILELKNNNQLNFQPDIEFSDDDEFEDAHESVVEDESIFKEDKQGCNKLVPLIPDDVTDQASALEHLSTEFEARYGSIHPIFFIGSLESAVKEALLVKAKDRKLLAIYLHHDSSILSNVFCSQILCSETIVSFLSNNFVTWAWDLTTDINKARLLHSCNEHFGKYASNAIQDFKCDQLPLLLIISRNRSTNDVCNMIHANVTLDELMSQLIQAVDVFHQQQQVDVAEEAEREQRELMKQEQDNAYLVSLAADKAKAEQRRAEEQEQKELELLQEEKILEESQRKHFQEMEKEAIRQSIANQLPDEPSTGCTEQIAIIRVRCPDGSVLTRRFLAENQLQVLLNYIASKGYHSDTYKVITTFPRRDLTQSDTSLSLKELKLFPSETVNVVEI